MAAGRWPARRFESKRPPMTRPGTACIPAINRAGCTLRRVLQVFDSDATPIALAMAAALICVVAGVRAAHAHAGEAPLYTWWAFAAVCVAIATGHVLHLGGGAAESGRDAFRFEGLYGSRRPFQALVVAGLLTGAFFSATCLLPWMERRLGRSFLLPAAALGGLVVFLAVRTISLHAIDAVLYGKQIFAGHPGALIEVSGLALFLVLAARTAWTSWMGKVPGQSVNAELPPARRRLRPQRRS